MRIIHTADLHYGCRQYNLDARENDFYAIGDHIAKRAVELKADIVVYAGDVFDMTRPYPHSVLRFAQQVSFLKNAGIKVLGIDGNHDTAGGNWMSLCGVDVLQPTMPYLYIDGKHTYSFLGIPSMRPNQFLATLDEIKSKVAKFDFLVIHQALAGMCGFNGAELKAEDITSRFKGTGLRGVLMGDIHNFNWRDVEGVDFCYPGSPETNSTSEHSTDKMMAIWEIDDLGTKVKMENLPARPVVNMSIKTEDELKGILATDWTKYSKPPLVLIRYEQEFRDLALRAEKVLKQADVLCRVWSMGDTAAEELNKLAGFERQEAMADLETAITAFHDASTPEYQLIQQILASPEEVEAIAKSYVDNIIKEQ